jgi:hypothetical protein
MESPMYTDGSFHAELCESIKAVGWHDWKWSVAARYDYISNWTNPMEKESEEIHDFYTRKVGVI